MGDLRITGVALLLCGQLGACSGLAVDDGEAERMAAEPSGDAGAFVLAAEPRGEGGGSGAEPEEQKSAGASGEGFSLPEVPHVAPEKIETTLYLVADNLLDVRLSDCCSPWHVEAYYPDGTWFESGTHGLHEVSWRYVFGLDTTPVTVALYFDEEDEPRVYCAQAGTTELALCP